MDWRRTTTRDTVETLWAQFAILPVGLVAAKGTPVLKVVVRDAADGGVSADELIVVQVHEPELRQEAQRSWNRSIKLVVVQVHLRQPSHTREVLGWDRSNECTTAEIQNGGAWTFRSIRCAAGAPLDAVCKECWLLCVTAGDCSFGGRPEHGERCYYQGLKHSGRSDVCAREI